MWRFMQPVVVLLAVFSMSCEEPEPAPVTAPPPPTAASEAAPAPTPAPAPNMATGEHTEVASAADRIAARHILVAHEDAANRPTHVHRSASAALAKAREIADRLASGEEFAALAKAESDCNSAQRGGFLGGFDRGTMDPAFEATAFALAAGQTSAVVESPFGYHIIRREALAEVRVAQILITFEGATGDSTQRSRLDAQGLMDRAAQRVADGEPFDAVAKAMSDGPSGLRGGDLGWFTQGQFLPAWEQVAFALEPGQTSAVFETSAGLHLLQRLE
jgi:peptidyl-prolyl cis-trans isomerase NIMA-interacting 1